MSSPTPLLGLILPVQGDLSGTWGDAINDSITSLLDSAVAGTTTLSADSDVTLTTTDYAANQARQAVILWTASNGATTRNITAPAHSKTYVVINAGTGSVVLRGAGPTTGVTIVSGEKCVAAWNGSDFVKVSSSTGTGTVTSVAQSFTGGLISVGGSPVTTSGTLALTVAGTSGGVPYFSSSSTWASSSALTANALMVGGGAGAAPSTATTGTGVVTALGVNTGSSGAFVVNGGALGTPSSGTLSGCTVDGTNAVGFRSLPAVGTKTGSYTLATGDVGKYVQVGSGGSITIPDATFSEGNAVSIFNNTSGSITITCSITTAYISGLDSDKASVSLASRGVATVLFISGTVCVISGSVS